MTISAKRTFGLASRIIFLLAVLASSPSVLQAQSAVRSQDTQATATDKIETADFVRVIDRLRTEVARTGPESVLLVVDVDNTLLAMQQDLGSDQWFNWQMDMLNKAPGSPELVAPDINGLLRAQGLLFALSRMHPPEPKLPALIAQGQQLGCPAIVLTSRGPDFRDATERELNDNGYDFRTSRLTIKEPQRGKFLPFDKNRPDAHGLSSSELAQLRDPRDVSYSQGIMMVAGQHKGYMLRALLARAEHKVRTIVFADDHQKHTDRLHDAFAGSGIQVITFRYSREDGNVQSFKNSDKQHAVRSWQLLDAVFRRTLVR